MDFRELARFTRKVAKEGSEDDLVEWLYCFSGSDEARKARHRVSGPRREKQLRWIEMSSAASEVIAEVSEKERDSGDAAEDSAMERLLELKDRDPRVAAAILEHRRSLLKVIKVLSERGPESVEPVPVDGQS